jgi:hypothetical protein
MVREVEDIREPSKSIPGFIFESHNCRSANGSTLQRWIAATTLAAVRPPACNFCRHGEWAGASPGSREWPPSASYRRRRSPLVENTAEASHRRSGYKTTGSATPCSKIQGRRGCTAMHAPTSAEGCSHQSAPPYGPSSRPSTQQKTPHRRDGSTGPVGVNPQKPLANRHENGRLRDGVGVEVMQLHPIVVRERPHEATRRHPKPPLMEGGETDHVSRRRSRFGLAPRGQPLRLRPAGERTEQTLGNKGLQILRSDGGERPRVARRNDGRLVSHRRAKAEKAEGRRHAVFLFSLSTLSGCESKGRDKGRSTSDKVKNCCWSPSQVYKDPSEIHPKLRLNPSWISNSRAERFFHSSNDSRTRNRYPVSRPSHRINSLAGHTSPLAGGQAPFRLHHDGRLKKVRHTASKYLLSSFSLSFSLSAGIGKRDISKESFAAKETGPEPSY